MTSLCLSLFVVVYCFARASSVYALYHGLPAESRLGRGGQLISLEGPPQRTTSRPQAKCTLLLRTISGATSIACISTPSCGTCSWPRHASEMFARSLHPLCIEFGATAVTNGQRAWYSGELNSLFICGLVDIVVEMTWNLRFRHGRIFQCSSGTQMISDF